MNSSTVITIGSINVDLVSYVQRRPLRGETLPGDRFIIRPGGKGANQAIRVALSGGRSIFVGKYGVDVFADIVKRNLESSGVDISLCKSANTSTGVGNVLVEPDGNYASVIVPGANGEFGSEDVNEIATTFPSADGVLLQLEIPMTAVERAVMIARVAGKKVFLNAAPAKHLPESLKGKIDVLIVNEVEAEMLSDLVVGEDLAGCPAIARKLQQYAGCVVISLGDHGVFGMDASGKKKYFDSHPVVVSSAIGAGDTFIGELVVRVLDGVSFFEAIEYANAAAAIVISSHEALRHVVTQTEFDSLLRPSSR
jgi:ribokinase